MVTSLATKIDQPLAPSVLNGVAEFLKIRDNRASPYSNNTYGDCTSFWGIIDQKGKFHQSTNTACHADLRYIQDRDRNNEIEFENSLILNSIQNTELDDHDVRNWIKWLIQDSPFAQYHVYDDVDWCIENKCVLVNPMTPTHLLFLTCFLIRSISERQNVAEGLLTSRLMDRGVEPLMAYFLACWFDLGAGDTVSFNNKRNNNHVYLNTCYWDFKSLRNWLNFEPAYEIGLWTETSGKHNGISNMFDSSDQQKHLLNNYMSRKFSVEKQNMLRDGVVGVEPVSVVHVSPFQNSKHFISIDVRFGEQIRMPADTVADYLVTLIPHILEEVENA